MADAGEAKDPEPAVRDSNQGKDKAVQRSARAPMEDQLGEIHHVEGIDLGGETVIIEKDETQEREHQQKQAQLSMFESPNDNQLVEEDVFRVVKQKNKFRAVFDMIPEAGILHDGKKILDVNKSFEKTSGYKKTEVIGKPMSKVLKGNNLIKKDGTSAEMLLEQSDAEENYILLMSDIGSLREMEKCYALFNILSDHIHDAVIQVDAKGRLVSANRAAEGMFGTNVTEFENTNLKDLFKRSSKLGPLLKKVVAGEIVEVELECVKGGSCFLASVLLHSINEGKEILCILRDVSKEKDLETQVREAREEHEQLVDNVNDIIFFMDYQGNIKYVNNQFERQLGYKSSEIKSLISIISHEDLQSVVARLSEAKKGFKDLEFRVKDSKGKDIYFSMNAVSVKEGSKVTGFRGTMRNVHEKKKAEDKTEQRRKELERINKELKDREEIKSKFISNVSHDLRTPLTSIQGYSDLLSNKVLGEMNKEQEEAANVIHSESKRLGKLINELLDTSRIEAGALALNKKPFLLSSLEDKCSCRPLAQVKGLTVIWNTPDKLGEVYGDPDRIAQVLVNLVSNSVKHTERGSITVNAFSKGKKFIQIDVIDTGKGIQKKEEEKIFDRFYQTDKKNKKGGTGLGLSIAKDIVELHGGHIETDSELVGKGRGAKFSFTLPKYTGEEQGPKLDEIIEDSMQNTEDLNKQETAQSVIEAINKTNDTKTNENKTNP